MTTPAGDDRPDRLQPLDPDSPKGRDVARRLSVVFAMVRQEIATTPTSRSEASA